MSGDPGFDFTRYWEPNRRAVLNDALREGTYPQPKTYPSEVACEAHGEAPLRYLKSGVCVECQRAANANAAKRRR